MKLFCLVLARATIKLLRLLVLTALSTSSKRKLTKLSGLAVMYLKDQELDKLIDAFLAEPLCL